MSNLFIASNTNAKSIFIVVRLTDENGQRDFEPLNAFSTFEKADQQAKLLKLVYEVEVHELLIDQPYFQPQGVSKLITAK